VPQGNLAVSNGHPNGLVSGLGFRVSRFREAKSEPELKTQNFLMSYLVLARKWRPQRFEDIAGQGHITRTLQNAIRTNRIAHAYLFTGVRGVGKTTAARILAKALNCEHGPTLDPCNNCGQCQEITNGNSIDVLEIDGASNRGIDEVRQIIENARYQPAKSRFKIYIIDEVHQVTKDAFNALLKTLEEPPPFVKFILATTEPHRLPETILSRCQRYDFRRIPMREIVQRLGEISKQEGLQITEAALLLLAREADGSMRDAQSLLEQAFAFADPDGGKSGKAIDEQLLHDVLGIAERELLYELSGAVIAGDAKRCIELIAEVVVQGRDLCRLSRDLVEHFRNLLVARLYKEQESRLSSPVSKTIAGGELLDLTDQEISELNGQVSNLSTDVLLDYFNFMAAADEEVARAANPRFTLEVALVRLATLPQTLPIGELLERLEKLEKKLSGGVRTVVPSPRGEAAEPPRRAPQAESAPTASESNKDSNDEKVWRELVAFVGKEKKFLASHLEAGTVLELTPGQIKIGFSERHHLSYLQDAEHLSALQDLASRFFARDANVSLVSMLPREKENQEPAPTVNQTGDNDESAMVKEALRIFGGSIKGVRREDG